jgi:methylmalonyl-CoA mutase N-terminal domain/subunit
MEEEMGKIIAEIEKMGGAIKATESGWLRQELEKELIKERVEIEEKKRIIVGLNEFVIPKEQEVPIRVGRDRPLEEQIATSEKREEEIKRLKETRDKARTKNALENLRSEAKEGERHNLILAIKQALKAEATLGEILGVIREANGASYDPFNMIQYPF